MRRGRRFANREMTATLTESDMEEYDTAIIMIGENSLLPSVQVEINGEVIPFVIDTGSPSSSICMTYVTALGFAKKDLLPREPDDSPYSVGYLELFFMINTFECVMEFEVYDMGLGLNLLGLDVLQQYCCVIDLDKSVLTFRNLVTFEYEDIRTPQMIVNIQGKDVEVEIDTGSEFFIRGTLAQAKELNLSLTKEDNYEIQGVGYTSSVEYTARDFCIKACGRERWDGEYAVFPDETIQGETETTMGVQFFYGARLEFTQDGGFEVTFPAEESEKPPVATSTEVTQGSGEEPAVTATEDPCYNQNANIPLH